MAESTEVEAGAPIAKDAIDPDLVKLSRARPKIGAVTSLGVVVLCAYFMLRLSPDRHFAGEPKEPAAVAVADVAAGKVESESYIALDGDPAVANAIRTSKNPGGLGMRITPMRGSGDRVWVALTDGDDKPTLGRYIGRLRPMDDMPFEEALRSYAAANPRPVFATVAAIKAGVGAGEIKTVTGNVIRPADTTGAGYDVIEPARAQIIVTFSGKSQNHGDLLDIKAWEAELAKVGIPVKHAANASRGSAGSSGAEGRRGSIDEVAQRDEVLRQARFEAAMSMAEVTAKLEAAKLWARVEPVVTHTETTWGALKANPAALAGTDLVGIYILSGIPSDAQILLVGERPEDYWHVMPVTIVLGLIALLFLWAFARAVKDLMPTRA